MASKQITVCVGIPMTVVGALIAFLTPLLNQFMPQLCEFIGSLLEY